MDEVPDAFLCTFLLLSYLIGAFGSVQINRHLKKSNFRDRPINTLISIDELIQFGLITFTSANIFVIVLLDFTPVQFFANNFAMDVDEGVIITSIIESILKVAWLIVVDISYFYFGQKGLLSIGDTSKSH